MRAAMPLRPNPSIIIAAEVLCSWWLSWFTFRSVGPSTLPTRMTHDEDQR